MHTTPDPLPDHAPAPAPPSPSSCWLLGWPGWAILALVGSLIIAWRIHDPLTLWIDETASIQVAQFDWDYIIRASSRDSHPPVSPILRKLWRDTGDLLGIPRHIAYDRAINLFLWLPWTAWLWWGLRRLLGRGLGAAIAACVALNPLILDGCDSIRMYAMGNFFVSGAALALALAVQEAVRDPGSRTLRWLAVYWVLAVLAFYTHVFAIPVLGLVGLAWLAGSLKFIGWRAPHFRWAFGAQMLGVAAFAPWVPVLSRALEFFKSLGDWWRTPATTYNLFRQFAEWFTFIQGPKVLDMPGMKDGTSIFMGLNVALWVLCAAGLVKLRRRLPRSATFWGAIAGCLVAVGFILFTWTATRLDIANVFHGYRYNFFGAPFWVAGLLCAAAGTGKALGWRWLLPGAVVLLLVQSMCSTLTDEERRLKRGIGHIVGRFLPEHFEPGQRLYVAEDVLIPYAMPILGDYDVHSVWELRDHPRELEDADIMFFVIWDRFVEEPTARLVNELMATDMAESHEFTGLANEVNLTFLLRLKGVQHDNLPLALDFALEAKRKPGYFVVPR